MQFRRACKLVHRASRLGNPRRQRRLVGRAMAALGKAIKLTTKGAKRGLSSDCAGSLMNLLEDTRGRAGSLEALL